MHFEKGMSVMEIYAVFGGRLHMTQIEAILRPRSDSDDDGEPD
jgi:hypothetical protein